MRILLAGATGAIGRRLVPQLLAAGHSVLGLTRCAHGATQLGAAGADAVRADVLDGEGLLAALAGCHADAVIHQATAIEGVPLRHRDLHATDRLRDRGTTNLLRAAELVGAHRFLTQSFFLGYGYRDHGDDLITEDSPFAEATGHRAFDQHMDSMRSNEHQALNTAGIDGIALRYGMFYGPEPATWRMATLVARRRLPVPLPSGTTSLIHIDDAASATVAALERGHAGEAYNVVDDRPVDFAHYVAAIADHVHAPAPPQIPGWLLMPVPYMRALMVATRIGLSNAKAKRELGWTPHYPSYREGLGALHFDDRDRR
ncbi:MULTISPECIES: NAD-dependent epimerase/dehydratase family protein [Prauserella salsuginis group]|uniref:NAD-dependent epimerase/dehydratase family protein n=1 Tax=Prauserella salsuginis TaxID=387889 RepID=A0ABW6G858_9PSEU|nr:MULTISPECIES: NAD(P)-dependent oxidoreductase [Prauserella salsuginis group]MCR3721754.1 Nucleoside-diphosphate-sugar epimerase [Prauserella flava]MCR3734445.1 Nucleoside-diphosphate-sugar epimerase [Prauserella salsuginis]